MAGVDTERARQAVRYFAETFTAQSKLSGRLWVAFMVVAVFVFSDGKIEFGQRHLPFEWGTVDPNTFDVIVFVMLAVLSIAFCQAYAQALRIIRRARVIWENLEAKETEQLVSTREYFDYASVPTLTRVSSLPQLFLERKKTSVAWRGVVASNYYLALKLTAIIIFFALPLYTLFLGYNKILDNQSLAMWLKYLTGAGGAMAVIPLFQVGYFELRQTLRIYRNLPQYTETLSE